MKTTINQDLKTCDVCGHTGPDVHEWPTYKEGGAHTEYQCDDYAACLTRKHNGSAPEQIAWAEAICPICGQLYPYIEDGYNPSTCNKFECVQKYLHPELRQNP